MNIGWNKKLQTDCPKIESYCKEKSGRKLQKNAMPVRGSCFVIKENTTMQDLHNLSKNWKKNLKSEFFKLPFIKMKVIMIKTPKNGNLIITLI